MKFAMIVPAYNEELTIEKTLRDLYRAMPDMEIWVINNNSKDHTQQKAERVLAELGAKGGVLFEGLQGKANAVRMAFHQIDADYYGMIDADATYPTAELPKLLTMAVSGQIDMLVGDRHSGGDYGKVMDRPFHNFGNGLVTYLINSLFQANLTDIMSGYRIFSRRFVKSYPILCAGFEIETEMSIHALDKRFRVLEVPISFVNRPEGSHSKLNTYVDGFRILKTIFKIFKDYHPLRFFGALCLVSVFFGICAGIPVLVEFAQTRYITHVPLAILATGFMIFAMIFLTIGLVLDTVVKIQKFNFELYLLDKFSK